jgi:ATP-dependent Clp protease ATP-binding subunit ClpB
MEIDSMPEEMDKLDRRLIQLKIEREALKKESDDASKKRLADLEEQIGELEREFSDLDEIWKSEKAAVQGTAHIKEELDRARVEMETARRAGDLARMSELQYGRIPELEKQLAAASEVPRATRTSCCATRSPTRRSRRSSPSGPASRCPRCSRASATSCCDGRRDRAARGRPAGGGARRVDAIRRSRAGLSDPNRPIGSFLFLGPTGVGKTELCKALAEFMFDTEEAMVRIDMSEFMEKHSVARLIGAPPGYVGYEEGGYLTEAVRRRPYSVILMDEVEKAHPDVFNVLLAGARRRPPHRRPGPHRGLPQRGHRHDLQPGLRHHPAEGRRGQLREMKDAVMEIVRQAFRPEFINRLDEIVVFHPLDEDQIRAIARIQIGYLQARLADRDMRLDISDAALDLLGEAGFDPVYGARPLKRAIRAQLENPLAQEILAGQFAPGDTIEVERCGRALVLRHQPDQPAPGGSGNVASRYFGA